VEFGAQEEKINIHAGKAAKAGILQFDIELDLKSNSILTDGLEVGSVRRWAAPNLAAKRNPKRVTLPHLLLRYVHARPLLGCSGLARYAWRRDGPLRRQYLMR
jgi:hypothetical protein